MQRRQRGAPIWICNEDVISPKGFRAPRFSFIDDLDFPAIYSTNYDCNLEAAFEIHDKAYTRWRINLLTPKSEACANDALTAFLADIRARIRRP
jgi:hypothetical protein